MNKKTITLIVLFLFFGLSCTQESQITQPSPLASALLPSENSVSAIFTATRLPNITSPPTLYLPPLLTPRVTPFPTRTRAEASEDLAHILKTNGDCKLPCFWGIRPDVTRYGELYSVIDNLGGYRFETLQPSGHHRIGSNFRFEDENRIQVEFQADVHDDIVRDLKVLLLNLWKAENTPKDWSAYNMDEILRIYGVPDKVELYFSGPYNSLSFTAQLKYDSIDTSIVYYARTTEVSKYQTPSTVLFCPEEIGINIVELHMGKYPFNTIPSGVPISNATGLNEQDFHKLFTENPFACLTLNRNTLP